MPLKVPASLRFSPAASNALDREAVDDLLALARKVQSPRGYKSTLEVFKKHFLRSTGKAYTPSSSTDWAETDLWRATEAAATDAAAFLVAFYDACEELNAADSTVPGDGVINSVLASHGFPFHIKDGELLGSVDAVDMPSAPSTPSDLIARALADASALFAQSGAASGVDRVHTALHGYLEHLCSEIGLDAGTQPTTSKLFKLLRQNHPALQPRGPRAADISRVLQSFAQALDALSPIRNKATLVHPNPLLPEPEAFAAINAVRTLFRYIQDRIYHHSSEGAA